MKFLKSDGWTSLGLALIALLARLPFRSTYLYHWDSVNFALSLEHYDVRLHQPHPPGYVLYSLLGWLVNLLVRDPNASLVWISLVSGVLGVLALYRLGALMFGRPVGWVAAVLALTSPQVWFHSEVALSYTVEFLLVTILAGLCYLQLTGRTQSWLWLTLLFGVAGGVRQNDLLFMFPLWLVCLWLLSWKQRVASLAVLGGVVAAWAWPMMSLSGGLAGYLAALGAESSGILSESPLFSAYQLILDGGRLALYVGYGLLLGIVPLVWGVWHWLRNPRAVLKDRRAWVLSLWIASPALFYLLVHVRQPGHIFTFLPALILLTAVATVRIGRHLAPTVHMGWAVGTLTGVLVAANASFFLWAPPSLFGSEQLPLQTPSRRTIQQRDRLLEECISYIREHFEPGSTVVLAGSFNFRHPDFYLRDYQLTQLSYRLDNDVMMLPAQVHTLVLLDERILPQLSSGAGFQTIVLPGGESLRYITWASTQKVALSQSTFELQTP